MVHVVELHYGAVKHCEYVRKAEKEIETKNKTDKNFRSNAKISKANLWFYYDFKWKMGSYLWAEPSFLLVSMYRHKTCTLVIFGRLLKAHF